MNHPSESQAFAFWVLWLAYVFVFYTYVIYPLLAAWSARRRPRPVARGAALEPKPFVSAIVAAHNEAGTIARRIENLLTQDYPGQLEVIAASDGSTDGTAEVLGQIAAREPRVRVVILEINGGKAAALNAALAEARGELVVFADARQVFNPDAVTRLVENFTDPAIGSVSGELVLEAPEGGVAEQLGLYWEYEKWIRQNESTAGSMLGATGAIYAIRRELWRPLPEGTILDDFLAPMRIVLAGWRAIFDGRAIAYDRAIDEGRREFRRKSRTLAGNFQAFAFEPGLLLPWRNPATWFQVWSHKAFRLLVPYALILFFIISMVLRGRFYLFISLCQCLFYGAAAAGYAIERLKLPYKHKLITLPYTFTTLNFAAISGLIFWLQGRSTSQLWGKSAAQSETTLTPVVSESTLPD